MKQPETETAPTALAPPVLEYGRKPPASPFGRAVINTGLQQALALMLAAVLLDRGMFARIVVVSMSVWWIGTLVIWFRRGESCSPGDVFFLRRGFFILLLLTIGAFIIRQYV